MNIYRLDEDQREEVRDKRMKPINIAFIIGIILAAIWFGFDVSECKYSTITAWVIMMALIFIPPLLVTFAYMVKNTWDKATVDLENERLSKEKRYEDLRKKREKENHTINNESMDNIQNTAVWQARDKSGTLFMFLNKPTLDDDGTWNDYVASWKHRLPEDASTLTFEESPKKFVLKEE